MPLSSIFGLEQPVSALRRMLAAEQLAGTYLLVGPGGVGKTTLALAVAEAAACTSPVRDPVDACGACESCRRAIAGAHPEIVRIAPAGDQTQIWQFWDRDNKPASVLQHSLHFAPVVGRKRVYIVERADTLTEPAANSLLKALEEPPAFVHFILLSPHPARMLPTILSRSHTIRLTPAPVDALAAWLSATRGLSAERARTLAAYSEGRAGVAIRLATDPEVAAEIARAVDLAESMAGAPRIRALRSAEELRSYASGIKALAAADAPAAEPDKTTAAAPPGEAEAGAAPADRVGRRQLGIAMDLMAAVFRDLLALRLGGEQAGIIHGDRRATLSELCTRRTPEGWMHCIATLLKARRRLDQNPGIPLLTDWLAIQLVNE